MRLRLFIPLALTVPSSLAFADSAAAIASLPFEDFKRIAGERSVAIDASTKEVILDFAGGIDPQPSQVAFAVKTLGEGANEISLEALMPLLEPERGQAVSAQMAKHDDALVRCVANIVLAASGNSDAAKSVHASIHDESLSQIDKRLIRAWCDGVGIRAREDDAAAILDHLSTALGGKAKLKKGDAAPDFFAETTRGKKLSSHERKGQVIVLHFWAPWCAPCMAKMPSHINALSKYDSAAVEVVFVSLDADREAFDAAVSKHGVPFKIVREAAGWGGGLARVFGVNSVPFDIVIGRDGKVFSNSIDNVDAALTAETAAAEQGDEPKAR